MIKNRFFFLLSWLQIFSKSKMPKGSFSSYSTKVFLVGKKKKNMMIIIIMMMKNNSKQNIGDCNNDDKNEQ